MTYKEFLERKIEIAAPSGFDISPDDVNSALKPHQRDSVVWAVKGGRRALFQSFGLGKTIQQLEFCRIVTERIGGRALIVLPLGVKQEFTRDAVKLLGMDAPHYVRSMAEIDAAPGSILLTNYERVRDGDIDPKAFTATSLDEASVLRSFGSKTYQTFMDKFKGVPYKLVCTATPSPNRYKELIHYAGYLEIMDTGQALTRFFERNSEKANDLTLYAHREKDFWRWLGSWALFVTMPSDLGYADEGYSLPPLEVRTHEIADYGDGEYTTDRDGQVLLMRDAALGLQAAAREKRDSMDARISKMAEIVNESPGDHFILWHDLEAERHAIERNLPTVKYDNWLQYRDGNPNALALYERHYSAYKYADGRVRKLFCGPGEKIVLMTTKNDALFVWRKFIDDSGQRGINCAVFRNEGDILSSELISEAMRIAWERWPEERLYTYVNENKIMSKNPGYCFKKSGWQSAGRTQGGLIILEAMPNQKTYQPYKLSKTRMMESVYGSQDLEERERRTIDFAEGKIRLLATKKEISGSGCNFQRHCHRAIFVGIDYEFNDFIQAIHRIHRFQQTETVIIDIIHTESEREIFKALMRKWEQHDSLAETMRGLIKEHGLHGLPEAARINRSMGVKRVKVKGKGYTAILNDCTLEAERMEENSVGLIFTSIPFGNHYEYTPNYSDFGHNIDTDAFLEQMDYLSPNLLRILQPGRIFACHVKDRVLFGGQTGTGMPTIEPFHALCIAHYMRHGFQYMGMITVLTDVVRENKQTRRLGWTQQCLDGTKMGVGCPDYILLFRKLPSDTSNAYADIRVAKEKEDYTRAQWQIDAAAFYRSSGDRLLTKDEIAEMPVGDLQKAYRKYSRDTVYSYEEHVELAKKLDEKNKLPASFAVVTPGSWSDEIWDDIVRMRTLNNNQQARRMQKHVCPLQIDLTQRIINRYTNPGDVVLDPFAGLFTVPLEAVKMGRYGVGIELNEDYYRDGIGYLQSAERKIDQPSLFDFVMASGGDA